MPVPATRGMSLAHRHEWNASACGLAKERKAEVLIESFNGVVGSFRRCDVAPEGQRHKVFVLALFRPFGVAVSGFLVEVDVVGLHCGFCIYRNARINRMNSGVVGANRRSDALA